MRILIDKKYGRELVVAKGDDWPTYHIYIARRDAKWDEANSTGIQVDITQIDDVIAALQKVKEQHQEQVQTALQRGFDIVERSGG